MHDEARSRRDVLKKAAAAGLTAGVVWTAPRVEGLSLRPDYAAAQTVVGSTFDLSIAVVGGEHATFGQSSSSSSPLPGIDRADVGFLVNADPVSRTDQDAIWIGQIYGSAVNNNCTIVGLDGTQNWADLSPNPPFDAAPTFSSSPSGLVARRTATGTSSNTGNTTLALHVVCT